ncbi:MAG: tyrosine-type recombinase/integrase [Opitutaceae bacterium]|nr:tyrosine-type recombinase/integrase [Opitutaceae bacterium]
MIEYVFKPSRRVGGKRILARLYSGRYSVTKGEKPTTVALQTPDKAVAEKRLRDFIIEKQKEQEGMIAPRVQREAAVMPLVVHVAEYKADLVGRELAPGHVRESVGRIERMLQATGWKFLSDIRPDSFMKFRAGLRCSAKTKKEYQTSINAFLNWCVRTDRITVHPLVKVDRVDTRGKSVRPTRSFTLEELQRLFDVSAHSLFYRTLLYTGQRWSEVSALVWSDLNFETSVALFREGTMKDKEKRPVPLHRDLVAALKIAKPFGAQINDRVFPTAPSYEILMADLERAGIERKDVLGRVLHFHAFRKTFQTMGVRAGINQRSAQALLGHSDPSLTANAYTDEAALHLHDEVAKLPWIHSAQGHSQTSQKSVRFRKIGEILAELVASAKALLPTDDTTEFGIFPLAARHGFEP